MYDGYMGCCVVFRRTSTQAARKTISADHQTVIQYLAAEYRPYTEESMVRNADSVEPIFDWL
jgi:hypothetical protein